MGRTTVLAKGLGVLALPAVLAAAYAALIYSPADSATGELYRIMYVHVGAAWTAYLAFAVTALAAVAYLVRRRSAGDARAPWDSASGGARLWDRVALASAEWGVVLTTITLITGSLWARSVNNWWWTWDARQTLTLLMWFLYAGYLVLRQYTEGERRATLSAVVAVAGIPAMVLNHFAVTLFKVDHPDPVVVRAGGAALSPEMILALQLSVVAFTLVYATLLLARIDLEHMRDEVAALRAGLPNA